MTPDILTPAQAAAHAQVSLDTIYEQVRQGRLPAKHIGRAIRIRRVDLEAWLAPDAPRLPWLKVAR